MNKLLLVEDDSSLSIGLVYYLNKEGYNVTHLENIKDTIIEFEKQDFDLVILDITLPDGLGFELAKFIKSKKNTPIIFLTAKDEEKDVLKGFEFGADDYITKPFSLKILNARIKRIIENTNNDNIKRYSGDLEVDVQGLKVYKSGKLIDLTPTEFKLLNHFMDNYGKVLNREHLLEFIWDTDVEFQSYSTIAVYINRLRDKIEEPNHDSKYIVTKRGYGYIWSMEVR